MPGVKNFGDSIEKMLRIFKKQVEKLVLLET